MDPFQELGSCDTRRQTEHRHRGILCVSILPTSTQSKGIFTWGYVRLQRENTSAVVTVGCFLPTNTNLWVFENSHWKGCFHGRETDQILGGQRKRKKKHCKQLEFIYLLKNIAVSIQHDTGPEQRKPDRNVFGMCWKVFPLMSVKCSHICGKQTTHKK